VVGLSIASGDLGEPEPALTNEKTIFNFVNQEALMKLVMNEAKGVLFSYEPTGI